MRLIEISISRLNPKQLNLYPFITSKNMKFNAKLAFLVDMQ